MATESKKARARELRKSGNLPEALLWNALKARQLGGYKFVRQYPIGPYIADIANRSHRLVIEIDGSQHVDNVQDQRRDAFIRARGYAVLRFWSAAVLTDCAAVCDTILAALEGRIGPGETSDLRYADPSPSRLRARKLALSRKRERNLPYHSSPVYGRGVTAKQ